MEKDEKNRRAGVRPGGTPVGDVSYGGSYSAMGYVDRSEPPRERKKEATEMKKTVLTGRFTVDGAGVKLFRVFANDTTKLTDPFLLLDNFGSDRSEDYIRGFPWHPHRGIETVTYMIEGEVEHADSIGNSGIIGSGDIQWMTAGGGIIHQEMPKAYDGSLRGTQLWVNLPAADKMIAPRYRGITAGEVPIVRKGGVEVRIIAGTYGDKRGPVRDLVVDVEYFDVSLDKGSTITYPITDGYTTFCYLLEGRADIEGSVAEKHGIVVFRNAAEVTVKAREDMRFMLASGQPLNEPIAWGGPIVMNTREELERAFRELDEGTFTRE